MVADQLKKFSQGSMKYSHQFSWIHDGPYTKYCGPNREWIEDLDFSETIFFYWRSHAR